MSNVHTREFAKGTVLFRQGEKGRELYVIQSGQVEVVRRIGSTATVLANLGSGEFVGEMAIITHSPRSATATVVQDAQMVVLDARTFAQMVHENREVAVRFIRQLAQRLDEADRRIEALLHRDPTARVGHWLMLESIAADGTKGSEGSSVDLDTQRVDGSTDPLAKCLGLTTEEVVVALASLEEAGVISRDGGAGLILNRERLVLHQAAKKPPVA
jgi:CRP/FNR family transcriptional regulator, cyclic AMP receptor protein